MRRLRSASIVVFLAISFSVIGLANPGCAYACSCVPPRPIAAYGADPGAVILSGTVTAIDQNQQGSFHVERWYKGTSIAVDVPIRGGNGGDCGIGLTVGLHMVMVASISDNMLRPGICSPWGDLATPEGRQLEDEAILAFGEGTLPGPHAGLPPGGTPPDTVGIPWIVVVVAGLAIVLIVVVAGASYTSKRRGG